MTTPDSMSKIDSWATVTSSSSPAVAPAKGCCRFCRAPLRYSFVDLGKSPLCENFLERDELTSMEPFYPLHAFVCERCYLVQVEEYVSGEQIFGGDYAYFSSYSESWLEHARKYVESIIDRLKLTSEHRVIEIASNDGYLLQNFVNAGIPALGIEPARNVAAAAREKRVQTIEKFFGTQTAHDLAANGVRADLLIANNVLAHVPDLNDFVAGMKQVLSPTGVITVEFPHLLSQMENNQFDTIYQEHYCYFSLHSAMQVFAEHGLRIFDLDHLTTHGGSLRVYATHDENRMFEVSHRLLDHQWNELEYGINRLETYRQFSDRAHRIKHDLLEFLIGARRAGKSVAGYGAPGKGNTLLNFCGIRGDLMEYVVDRNPFKHGKYLPGTHLPVFPPDRLSETRPDYILLLPWNLKDELTRQLEYTREWGAKLVVAIPKLTIE